MNLFPLKAIFFLVILLTLAPSAFSEELILHQPTLPWTPEELIQTFESTWPKDNPSDPDTPGHARLRVRDLKKWQADQLEGSENAFLGVFARFEDQVKKFSADIEMNRNHKDPSQRLSSADLAELNSQYRDAYSIVNGVGGYLNIYRQWNKRYAKELKKWQNKL